MWFVFYSLYFFKSQFQLIIASFLSDFCWSINKPLFGYIKHTLVFPYCIHSLPIPINICFVPIIAFHYYPIFFLCPVFSNPPHSLFIFSTRISLDSFRWKDSSISSRVKLQLRYDQWQWNSQSHSGLGPAQFTDASNY